MTDSTPQKGDNNPPEKTPFEVSQENILDLYEQAQGWFDGEPITTQAQADDVQTLMRMMQEAAKTKEVNRKAEAKPFDEGKAKVQKRYKTLTEKLDLAISTCKTALMPFLVAEQKKATIAAKKAQDKAEEAQKLAAEKLAAAKASSDLDARAEAEKEVKAAKKQGKVAAKKGGPVKASGMGRSASLRKSYTPKLTDVKLAASWFYHNRRPSFDTMVLEMARREGHMVEIPGIEFEENKTVA